ncbi:MAG: DUF948 domain-containing protein [Melioribacteraceae bacterium]|jgi:uncharacterized protein YoxC|nr:DUF948 domain-containing protein [Melioribacteraceae bacterium]
MEFVEILLAILLIIASVLGLYLIKLVKRLFITLDLVEAEVKELDAKITPLLTELQQMADFGNSVATFAKEQTDFANGVIEGVKNRFGGFSSKGDENSSTKSNAHNLVTNLRALFKGATSFISELK